ncbi:MAG: addiction module protein [Planctomycetes bacterium]|nr:addiction module protein [Planctomycetota bacterium]MBM4085122.1 addiction module protein [Planctomycetota bacterium]
MSPVLEKVEKEALALPEPERATLVEHLVNSLSDRVLNEVDEAWVAEAERRYNEYRQGRRTPIAAKDFFPGIRKALGW